MTRDEIWQWQCEMFIYSCYLYEIENSPIMDDNQFDQHCVMLLKRYDQLPQWFTARVSKGQLEAGTAQGLEYSQADIDGAHKWQQTAAYWRSYYGLDR